VRPPPAGASGVRPNPQAAPVLPAHGSRRPRLLSVDLLRGLAILLVMLEQGCEFFGPAGYSATDLSRTHAALFLTRWLSHPGAPLFVFLTGVAVRRQLQQGSTRLTVAGQLVARGLWLLLLDLTWVSAAWTFDVSGHLVLAQLLWVTGASMLVLALLVLCPLWVSVAFGVLLVGGHDLLDGLRPADTASPWLWQLLHVGGARVPVGGSTTLLVVYPLLPWPGIMALGHAFGAVLAMSRERRYLWSVLLGLLGVVLFMVLRLTEAYGEPASWKSRPGETLGTVLSFVNCTKHPASLLFVLMSLGPPLLLLPLLDRGFGSWGHVVRTYGSVPIFLYLMHVPLIHAAAWLWSLLRYGEAGWWVAGGERPPDEYLGVIPVYVATALVVALLSVWCRALARYKRQHRRWWLLYL